MTRHLKNLIMGASQVLVLCPQDQYIRPARGDFSRDAERLREDASRVAGDLRNALKKHGKSVHYS